MGNTNRVRISNGRLNSFGTRVLTEGMDVEQYRRNPVLLFMHRRGDVIGFVKDLRVEGDEVTGELVFDEASDLSVRCKKQWEFGSLKMVSAGIDIKELSEDPAFLVQGQTRPTVSKSKLYEVSVVDVGANDDALHLQKDGQLIGLGKDGGAELPLLNINQKAKSMELKQLALSLGLPETADEATVNAKIDEMKRAEAENKTLRDDKDRLTLAAITAAVDKAIGERKITPERKDQFISLGKTIGVEELEKTFGAMSPAMKLSNVLGHQGGQTEQQAEYKKLSDVPAEELATMRSENLALYKKLYKAEYGIECVID